VFAQESESTGTRIYAEACRGGAQALGREVGAIAAGKRADIVVLDAAHPDVTRVETALDAYVFSAGNAAMMSAIVGGAIVVADGRHRQHDSITQRYRKTIEKLSS
jgi:cytosine/adenosine deaminase-related metal-dependent hydrolase